MHDKFVVNNAGLCKRLKSPTSTRRWPIVTGRSPETLAEIESSKAWKLVTVTRKIRARLIPKDSHRKHLAKKVWRGITGMNPKASLGNRFRSKLLGIIPSASRDNSTSMFQCTLFLKLGSHYNLSIPLRCAFVIGVS